MQPTKSAHISEEKLETNQMNFSFPITDFISAVQKSCEILTTVVTLKIISSVKTAC